MLNYTEFVKKRMNLPKFHLGHTANITAMIIYTQN